MKRWSPTFSHATYLEPGYPNKFRGFNNIFVV